MGVEILFYLGLCLVAVVLLTILRQDRQELAVMLSMVVGIIILTRLSGRLAELISAFRYLATQAQISQVYLETIFKVMGVAYLAGFGGQICRDAGEGALGLKLELAGKIIILFFALPVMVAILEMVLRIF
ncbi:MAG: stage III sporulation protein AD [Firmicutes bacterium]|nr:stage III sporulation protein AD [Bacillota bacterium]